MSRGDVTAPGPSTRPMVMAGRRMGGYIHVEAAALTKPAVLAGWLRRALDYVGTLPRKKAAKAAEAKRAAKRPKRKTAARRYGKRFAAVVAT